MPASSSSSRPNLPHWNRPSFLSIAMKGSGPPRRRACWRLASHLSFPAVGDESKLGGGACCNRRNQTKRPEQATTVPRSVRTQPDAGPSSTSQRPSPTGGAIQASEITISAIKTPTKRYGAKNDRSRVLPHRSVLVSHTPGSPCRNIRDQDRWPSGIQWCCSTTVEPTSRALVPVATS